MVYDMTGDNKYPYTGEPGYAIHEDSELHLFEVYTDDGKGNGDHVCTTGEKFWAIRIASALEFAYSLDK